MGTTLFHHQNDKAMNYEYRHNSITDGLTIEEIALAYHCNAYKTHAYRLWHNSEEFIFVSNVPPSGGVLEVAVVNQTKKRLVAVYLVGWIDHLNTVISFFRSSLEQPHNKYFKPDTDTYVPFDDDTNIVTLRCGGCDKVFNTKADHQYTMLKPESIAHGVGYCPLCEAILKPNKITK